MIQCKECGAQYDLQMIKLPVEDKDRILCLHCKESLISWDGSHMYCIKEISGPTKEEYKFPAGDRNH